MTANRTKGYLRLHLKRQVPTPSFTPLLARIRASAVAAADLPPTPSTRSLRLLLLAHPAQHGNLHRLPVRYSTVLLTVADLPVWIAVDMVARVFVVVFLTHGDTKGPGGG